MLKIKGYLINEGNYVPFDFTEKGTIQDFQSYLEKSNIRHYMFIYKECAEMKGDK